MQLSAAATAAAAILLHMFPLVEDSEHNASSKSGKML
jgi:hypothetical protein